MMFTITGQLISVIDDKVKDRETDQLEDKKRIQILGDIPLPHTDGNRKDLVTLGVQDLEPYRKLQGQVIRVPFGFFAQGKGSVITFIPKGAKPEVVTQAKPGSSTGPASA